MLLRYPYPYKAWLTIANDPDNTLLKDWRELHNVIWEELKLPFADTLFINSYNVNLPGQVNLTDHPQITRAHSHDAIHTWGDFMHARSKGFDRKDAEEAIQVLKLHSVQPKVWIDHAQFEGNLLHYATFGSRKVIVDKSGHHYKNYRYTLDLITQELGIRFFWDGKLTPVLGQDRTLTAQSYFSETSNSRIKAYGKTLAKAILPNFLLTYRRGFNVPENHQYQKYVFPDGNAGYIFRRYGTWEDADIYGLHNLINPKSIEQLLRTGGTAIVYTHLGKRPADKMGKDKHIPEMTLSSLHHLREKYISKSLMLTSTSELLEYLVIRDHIEVSKDRRLINFKSDGVRFKPLTLRDLSGKKFSFRMRQKETSGFVVAIDGKKIDATIARHDNQNIFTVDFS